MSKTTQPKSGNAGTRAIDAANNLVDQVTALVGPAPALSASDVRRSTKLRKGGEKVIPTVVALSEQYNLTLPKTSTATILAKMQQAQDLVPLQKKLTAALKHVTDVIFAANSESWEGTTMHYTVLRRLAKADGDLEASLVPVREFFAKRSAEVVNEEKEMKAARTVARATKAMAKANAKLATIQGAPAAAKATIPPAGTTGSSST